MPLPLIALAIGAGAARFGVGAYQNRKETRRKRKLLQEQYRTSADRLTTDQVGVRQATNESLVARGLTQGGNAERIGRATEANSTDPTLTMGDQYRSAIAAEMAKQEGSVALGSKKQRTRTAAETLQAGSGQFGKPTSDPTTLGGQVQADTERELGYEWKELSQQLKTGTSSLKAASQQQTLSDIGSAIQTGASVYSAGKTMKAPGNTMPKDAPGYGESSYPGGMLAAAGGAASPVSKSAGFSGSMYGSPIADSMAGAESASNWFGGIIGSDPLAAMGSTWNRNPGGTMLGGGQTNAEFNVSP